MSKEMLINTVEGHECRIAVVEDGVLEELYMERASSASRVGNIYKGRVTNVEAAIQAAFVDFGSGKNGFLHISDVNPQYFPRGQKGPAAEAVGKKRSHRDRPPIQECLRRGQEVIVQMTKEGIGTKGPTMTTYLSIPGRLLVMMPGMSRLGVSRKIMDEEARQHARQVLEELNPPSDMGFILRTAGMDRSKRELQRDLHYLTRLWKSINHLVKTAKAPAELYQESDLVIRTLRDVYNTDIDRIICDNESVAKRVKEFLDMAMPRSKHAIELYAGKEGLFHDLGLEAEIEKVFSRRVELKSGGWLAFDQTEALVAIDVNSGRFREHSDAEMTAFKINQEAAGHIARQLRLRDLGGVVIIDFIDMRDEKNRRTVERVLRDAVKKDRAKTKVLKISALGIVEMTRQRVRPSLRDSIYRRCVVCDGTGLMKSEESQALTVMRNLQRAVCQEDVSQIEVVVTGPVAHYLSNIQRQEIAQLEAASNKLIVIKADPTCRGDEVRITCTNPRGSTVAWDQPIGAPGKKALQTVNFAQIAGQPEEELPYTPEEAAAEAAERVADEEEYEPPEALDFAESVCEEEAEVPEAPSEPAAPAARPDGRPSQPGQAPRPAPAGQPGQPGQPGQGKRRRRGRRGGQRHRRHGQGQPGQAAPGQAAQQPSLPGMAETSAPQADQAPAPQPAPEPAEVTQREVVAMPQHPPAMALPSEPIDVERTVKAARPRPQPIKPAESIAQAGEEGVETDQSSEPGPGEGERKKSRRRGRRGGRRHRRKPTDGTTPEGQAQAPDGAGEQAPPAEPSEPSPQ